MSLDKLLITTTGGNSIVDSGSSIFSHLTGNEYLKKAARELNAGELIRFRKEYVQTTLEEVEPVLDKSLRYAVAKKELHEQNSKDELIPLLRKYIIKGIYEKAELPPLQEEELDKKILKEGEDFDAKEYSRMIDYLDNFIKDKSDLIITRPGITNWIKGETIAPQDWEFFRVLENLNPSFKDFDQNARDPNSKAYNYKLYVTTRRVIMHYLDECRAKGKGLPKQTNTNLPENRLSLAPEISLVVDYFFRDINEQYLDVRVTDIRKIQKKDIEQKLIKTDKKLNRGVVTDDSELELQLCGYNEAIFDEDILSKHASTALHLYKYPLNNTNVPLTNLDRHQILGAMTPIILNYFLGEKSVDKMTQWQTGVLQKMAQERYPDTNIMQQIERVKDYIIDEILTNKFDDYYRFDRGTTYKLLQTIGKVKNTCPPMFANCRILAKRLKDAAYNPSSIHPIELEEMFKQQKHFIKRLSEQYGIGCDFEGNILSDKLFLTDLIFSVTYLSSSRKLLESDIPSLMKFLPRDELIWLGKKTVSTKTNILTRESVIPVLQKYDLAQIAPLRDFEYVLDDFFKNNTWRRPSQQECDQNINDACTRFEKVVAAAYSQMLGEKGIILTTPHPNFLSPIYRIN